MEQPVSMYERGAAFAARVVAEQGEAKLGDYIALASSDYTVNHDYLCGMIDTALVVATSESN